MEYRIAIALTVASILFYRKKRNLANDDNSEEYSDVDINAKESKEKFLQSDHGQHYGYRSSTKGYIDTWRAAEYPHLIPPFGEERTNDVEIYLDSAGAALPSISLLEHIHSFNMNHHLGNPHSLGPAAARSKVQMEITKTRLLTFFGANTGSMFGYNPDSTSSGKEMKSKDFHPGYEIIFTSGATEALRIVADNFRWTAKRSLLMYAKNSHTSVIGMREAALRDDANFRCEDISNIINASVQQFDSWASESNQTIVDGYTLVDQTEMMNREDAEERIDDTNHLLVLPLECNFGGELYNVTNPISTSRKAQGNWVTMLDISKAASTSSVDLRELDPDFACVSFYKCFGAPTGIGALIIKRSSMKYLTTQNRRRYFGGGSVDVVSPMTNLIHRRGDEASTPSLIHGTPNFRNIPVLCAGMDEVDSLGGMNAVTKHIHALTTEALKRLQDLHHNNGSQVILLYNHLKSADRRKPDLSSIITFNIRYSDGSFVGYNTVCKLAEIYKIPIQLRSGCFCNPGACQDALGLTDSDLEVNYKKHGHVCGDHIDIVDGKPTGCLRISFGKETIFEDIYCFIEFIENTFVSSNVMKSNDDSFHETSDEIVRLEKIFLFPIKSCGAYEVSTWPFDHRMNKLLYDREYVLIDNTGTAIRLNQYPKMCLVSPKIDLESNTLTVSAPGQSDLCIALDHGASTSKCVQICRDKCFGYVYGNSDVSDWFSSYLQIRCWLVKWDFQKNCNQIADDGNSISRVGFANEAPILLLSLTSIEKLNCILVRDNHVKVNARHFRPNLVVSSKKIRSNNPEEKWISLYFPKQKFTLKITGKCQRCAMIDIDPSSGMKGKTLRALVEFRKNDRGANLTFGVFAEADTVSRKSRWNEVVENIDCRTWIHIGDTIIAQSKQS